MVQGLASGSIIVLILRMFLSVACLASISSAFAAEPLLLTGNASSYELGHHIDVFEDKSSQWKPGSGISKENLDFRPSNTGSINYGYTNSTIWLRFQLQNPLDVVQAFKLRIDFPLIEEIELYTPTADGFVIQKGGSVFATHQYKDHRTPVFDVAVPPRTTMTYYMGVAGDETMQLSLALWLPEALAQFEEKEQFAYGVYFGIILVMALYNLFLYLFVRDLSYLFYVVYISCLGVFTFSQNGLALPLLLPEYHGVAKWMNPLSCFTVLFSVVLFTQTFLRTDFYTPTLHRLLKLELVLSLSVVAGFVVGDFKFTVGVVGILTAIIIVTILSASVMCLIEGYMPARYFLIAFALMIVGSVLYVLKSFGFLPPNVITNYGLQIGSGFEVVLLSLGLASRINTLKQEKTNAERRALEAALSANQLKDDFMSTITHELLTPINGVRLSLDLLKNNKPNKDDAKLLNTASHSSDHLLSLVESMFVFVEARRGSMQLNPTKVHFRTVFEDVFQQFESEKSNDLNMMFKWDSALPEYLLLDEKKTIILISQLLKNAISYISKGEITMSAERISDNTCLVSIRDTGKGIDSRDLNKIFEAFRQEDNSMKREYGGLGLGLTIARDILNLMDAQLSLDSSPGRGTTVSFEMLMEQPSEQAVSSSASKCLEGEAIKPISNTPKILVVEDNPVNSKLLCKTLESLGCLPLSAIHGREAIDILDRDEDIHAIFMDCQMPVMDGYEATRAIRKHEHYATIPIIAVTANVSMQDQTRCKESGMDDFLSKPVSVATIEQTLDRWHVLGR